MNSPSEGAVSLVQLPRHDHSRRERGPEERRPPPHGKVILVLKEEPVEENMAFVITQAPLTMSI